MYKISQCLFSVLVWILIASCNSQAKKELSTNNTNDLSDSAKEGKIIFEAGCVRCHGMDASGLTGPSLRKPKLKHATDVAAFTSVVEQGIAGTGMPSNWSVTDAECRQIYAYLSYLKNQGRETASGDSAAGSLVYMNAACSKCHMMKGQGNGFGPDLSAIGFSRNPAYLRQSILDPGATLPESTDIDNGYGFSLYLPVKIVTAEGKEITGVRMNEDTYTIQIKDLENHYYSFYKNQLRSLEKLYGQSLMPSFKNTLSDQEVNNLVAFLFKTGDQ
jgi:cytochrome c oxidase cbb3-type subunit III